MYTGTHKKPNTLRGVDLEEDLNASKDKQIPTNAFISSLDKRGILQNLIRILISPTE